MDLKISEKRDNTYCCVPQCKSRGSKTNYSFHLFPAVKSVCRKTTSNGLKMLVNRRMEWKLLLRIGKEISNRMTVCSKHFDVNAYTFPPEKCQRRRLKPSALPTLFLPKTSFHSEEKITIKEKASAKKLARYSEINRKKRISYTSNETPGTSSMTPDSSGISDDQIVNVNKSTDELTAVREHFEESQFEQNRADGWKKLKQTAIPTLFNLPNAPKKVTTKRVKGFGNPKPGSILDAHLQETHQKLFPVGTKIISCQFSSEKYYTAELRLKCKSEEEFKIWLTDFEKISCNTYYVAKTIPTKEENVLYKALYRCQHKTYPFSHGVVKTPSTQHTDCSATLNVVIKVFGEGPKNRSQDALVAEYPTIVTIRHNHNHAINVAEVVEYRDLEENVDPSWHSPLLPENDQRVPEDDSQNDLEEMESDAGVSDDLLNSDDEPEWEEIELMMKDITVTFKEKFKEDTKDCFSALKSMHKSIKTMNKTDLLSAMQNFGKDQCKTISGRNSPLIHIKQEPVSQKQSNISTSPYVLIVRPVK